MDRVYPFSECLELYKYLPCTFPIIMQLILTYIVYREHKENKIIKWILITGLIYTLISGTLALYDSYYKSSKTMFNDLSLLFVSQMAYQLLLALILFICLITNKVNSKVAIEAILMPLISIALLLLCSFLIKFNFVLCFLIHLIILYTNGLIPILIYILSYTAKGELFIKKEEAKIR